MLPGTGSFTPPLLHETVGLRYSHLPHPPPHSRVHDRQGAMFTGLHLSVSTAEDSGSGGPPLALPPRGKAAGDSVTPTRTRWPRLHFRSCDIFLLPLRAGGGGTRKKTIQMFKPDIITER